MERVTFAKKEQIYYLAAFWTQSGLNINHSIQEQQSTLFAQRANVGNVLIPLILFAIQSSVFIISLHRECLCL